MDNTQHKQINKQNFFINKGRKGLGNVGATCYINTAIQCLTYCLDFLDFVLSERYKKQSENCQLMIELREICIELWINDHNIIPHKFVSALQKKFKDFELYRQNDINEFLMMFIDILNKDICYDIRNKKVKSIVDKGYISSPYDMQRYKMDLSWFDKVGTEYSELTDMFHGQMITQIICGNCQHISHNYEIYSSIMLSLDHNDILECLNDHFKEEILNTGADEAIEWKCDECKCKAKSKKTHRLWRNPKILIVSMKRFTYDLKKNNTKLIVPEELSLNEFTISDNTPKYKLISVAYHLGSYHGGHYFACCKHPNGKWYRIDDLDVEEIQKPDLSSGYVFFYSS